MKTKAKTPFKTSINAKEGRHFKDFKTNQLDIGENRKQTHWQETKAEVIPSLAQKDSVFI